jgi:hypothetical protein
MKSFNMNTILMIGAAIMIYMFGKKAMEKLGVINTPAEDLVQNTVTTSGNPFSPVYYQSFGSGTLLLTRSTAEAYAKQIFDAFNMGFGENFPKIFGVFRLLRTKSQVSFLADVFQQKYTKSLLDTLHNGTSRFMGFPWEGLSGDELAQIISYVDTLPASRV